MEGKAGGRIASRLLRGRQTCLFRKRRLDWSVYKGRLSSGPMAASPPFSAKRDQLQAIAWRLFYRDGFQRVGIDTILAESGVAKRTLYRHFRSKDELIVAVLDERSAKIVASLDRAIAAAAPNPQARLLAVFDWLGAWFAEKEFRGCAFLRALGEFPDRRHPVHQAAWRFKEAVRQRLLRLARENQVREPAALAEALALLIDGAIVTAHASGNPRVAARVKRVAGHLLAGAGV